jgi:hypothetical protein
MDVSQIPTPPSLAARPRDARGYPVLAITPWAGGVPDFAVTAAARILICAAERRCSICGTTLDPGAVHRVVADAEAVAMRAASDGGESYANRATTTEPGGHRACMLYAAVVCPYLARPNARRGLDGTVEGQRLRRGEARGQIDGLGGAVVGFEAYTFEVGQQVLFRFSGLCEFLPHQLGARQLPALHDAVAAASPHFEPCPPYLLADERAAQLHASRILAALRPA